MQTISVLKQWETQNIQNCDHPNLITPASYLDPRVLRTVQDREESDRRHTKLQGAKEDTPGGQLQAHCKSLSSAAYTKVMLCPHSRHLTLWPIYLPSYLSLRPSSVMSCIVSCVFGISFFLLSSLLAELLLYYPPVILLLQMQRSQRRDATSQRRFHTPSPWSLGDTVAVLPCDVCRWFVLVLFAQVKEMRLRKINYCLLVWTIHISLIWLSTCSHLCSLHLDLMTFRVNISTPECMKYDWNGSHVGWGLWFSSVKRAFICRLLWQ